jgi:hypothetical protein
MHHPGILTIPAAKGKGASRMRRALIDLLAESG